MYIEEQLEMPRFTGTLRAFSNVSQKQQDLDPEQDRKIIKKKIQQLVALDDQAKSTQNKVNESESKNYTWPDVMEKLTANKKVFYYF